MLLKCPGIPLTVQIFHGALLQRHLHPGVDGSPGGAASLALAVREAAFTESMDLFGAEIPDLEVSTWLPTSKFASFENHPSFEIYRIILPLQIVGPFPLTALSSAGRPVTYFPI